MTFLQTLKTTAFAATLAVVGIAANAATVAEVSASGSYFVAADLTSTELSIGGVFSAAFDPTFNTTAVNDFLFEADLTATDLPTIDEELLVTGITGDDIIATTFGILLNIETSFPGVLGMIFDEVTDGDMIPSNIFGALFGFDFAITGGTASSVTGTFSASLADGILDLGQAAVIADGVFNGSASISTVPAVPLPATLPLLAFAGTGLFAMGRRRKS